jgi:CheY-like chemotaxis protein
MGTAGTRTVLVVTDSSAVLTVTERLCGSYTLQTARSLRAGVEHLDERSHVLVVDECLPDGDGVELVETATACGLSPRAAVLSRTGGPFPDFDVVLEGCPSAEELTDGLERLFSLREYDERVDRLYELVRHESRTPAAGAVGDGGFDRLSDDVREARDDADDALLAVDDDDRSRLLVEPTENDGDRDE